MKSGEERHLAVPSSGKNIRILAEFAREALSASFDDHEITAIEVAVVEAANNILKHSYSLESGYPIELTIYNNGKEIEFLFQDQGRPFNQSEQQTLELNCDDIHNIPESGRGIFIMKEIMDSVEYIRINDINQLLLKKSLSLSLILTNTNKKNYNYFIDRRLNSPHIIETLKSNMAINEIALEEMAEELSTAYESLNLFYALSKDVALISNIDSFLDNTLEKVLYAAKADWGVVRLVEGENLIFYSGTEHCPKISRKKSIPIIDNSSIEGKVTNSMSIELDDYYHELEASVICLPIVGLDAFIGTILLGKTSNIDAFSSGEAKVTRALADQVAVSIENSRLYSKAMDAELAEKEMEIANSLQKQLILKKLPSMPQLNLYTKLESAKQVGGDYLTLYKINENILYFTVCDAMGKGMSASYFSLLSHMALHSIVIQQDMKKMTPGTLLSLINRIMESDFDLFGMFMTAFVGKIDIKKNSLEYASAGHCQPIYYTPKKGLELLDTSDFMLGVASNIKFKNFKTSFNPGTKLLIYSDGLTDITDKSGEILGIEPLEKLCKKELKNKNINDACEKIYQEIIKISGYPLQDDISMIGIERVVK